MAVLMSELDNSQIDCPRQKESAANNVYSCVIPYWASGSLTQGVLEPIVVSDALTSANDVSF